MSGQEEWSESKMHSLNVVVSRTSTKIGEMIRTVIGGKYNHCSFFLDDEIDIIYGFSRKYRDLWFTGCFTQENPLYYEEYLVYRIPLGDEEFERLSARVARMCDHVKMYDYVAAALISIDVPKESNRHYICSTFVADLLDKHTAVELNKNAHLYKPMDIFALMESAVNTKKAKHFMVTLPVQDEIHPDATELLEAWTASVKKLAENAENKVMTSLYIER